uniref:Uncharacterized protein n=1 Tax=Aegilops tauschii subsp. strangulata TaxID=200361 RepID=A0A453LD52_AEGTS
MVNFSKKLTTDQVPGWEEYVKFPHFFGQLDSAHLLFYSVLSVLMKHHLSACFFQVLLQLQIAQGKSEGVHGADKARQSRPKTRSEGFLKAA